jgi:hypothetical protein
MKRIQIWSALALAVVIAAPVVSADVKTKEKTMFALEGFLGGVVRVFGGRAAREGIESTTAVKGDRKITLNNSTGRIVDLREQKAYELDVRRKEYTVVTFAELRAQFEKAKAEAAKRKAEASPEEKQQMEEAGKQLEFDAKVDETGQKKTIAGHETREVVLTITGREKGKTLEEMYQFELRAAKAIYGEDFMADMQQAAAMIAMYPSFTEMSKRMQAEGKKLQGTALSTTMVFEGVKSAEQMKAEGERQQSSGGGGLSGALARRMMGNRAAPSQRAKVLTTTHDLLSIDMSVADADVALPAGYKEKK